MQDAFFNVCKLHTLKNVNVAKCNINIYPVTMNHLCLGTEVTKPEQLLQLPKKYLTHILSRGLEVSEPTSFSD